ncbi:copper homeostasis membrane protein CopD [Herbaspirillum sp. DW155]|uniref:copper homeostasis membrane protein CopD n=1 Tax=Herbaspirillum sp. DW155 TaxID=3095609 RepID=UPI00308E41F9|nr:copper homeostasis membrane protein CopD [Herbaspirillum sp. DW155]
MFLLGLCRLLLDGAALFLWGMALMLLALVDEPLRSTLWQRLARWRRLLTGLVFIALAATLPLQASILGDGWSDAWHPDMWAAVANGTSIGTAWWCQLACLSLLILSAPGTSRMRMLASVAGSGGLLASLALTGHAVMQDGWRGGAHQVNDVLHVWSVGAWTGALPVVLLILSKPVRSAHPELTRGILRRFSAIGHAVVALVWVTGLCNTFFILGTMPLDWRFPYQGLLTLKMLVVGVMVLIAIFNRYRLVPAMRRDPAALDRLCRLTQAEIMLAWLALLLLAWLGMLQPN